MSTAQELANDLKFVVESDPLVVLKLLDDVTKKYHDHLEVVHQLNKMPVHPLYEKHSPFMDTGTIGLLYGFHDFSVCSVVFTDKGMSIVAADIETNGPEQLAKLLAALLEATDDSGLADGFKTLAATLATPTTETLQ